MGNCAGESTSARLDEAMNTVHKSFCASLGYVGCATETELESMLSNTNRDPTSNTSLHATLDFGYEATHETDGEYCDGQSAYLLSLGRRTMESDPVAAVFEGGLYNSVALLSAAAKHNGAKMTYHKNHS